MDKEQRAHELAMWYTKIHMKQWDYVTEGTDIHQDLLDEIIESYNAAYNLFIKKM